MSERRERSTIDSFERLVIDPLEKTGRELAHLLNAIVVPRAIAWVSTISDTGVTNLAPHSYTTVLSPHPPIVGFVSVGQKDTLRNVRSTGDFVYNVATEELLDAVNLTASDFPPDISEFDWAGLTTIPSDHVRSPRLAESPLSMEARLEDILQVADTNNFLVMGRVVRMHLARSVLNGDRIDVGKVRPPARLGGSQYSLFGEIVTRKRPVWADLRNAEDGKTAVDGDETVR
ncbi:MAG: flavin reductase family protein [Thermomicrobiales bacterium]